MAGNRRGHDRERAVRKQLAAEGWLAFRAPASLGCADVIAMRSADWLIDSKPVSEVLLIEVKSTAGGPYEHFGPADRARLLAAAKQAGASAALAWWPKNGKLTWYPSANWPSRGTQLALEA